MSTVESFSLWGSMVTKQDVLFCVTTFIGLYFLHFALYMTLPSIMTVVAGTKGGAEVVSSKTNLMKLSRFTIDFLVMIVFSVLGFVVLSDFGSWHSLFSDGSKAFERVYLSASASSLLLCRIQISYEAKNLVDSFIFGDGLVFIIHHIATGTLAIFALHPYLHIYSSFFFGISEVSTAVLCALACFDDSRGITDKNGDNIFAKLFPTTMKVTGVIFAVLFIIFRIIIWPIVSYSFWLDSLAILKHPQAHSPVSVYTFLISNVGLTILQFMWLAEIIMSAIALFSGKGVKSSITSTMNDDSNVTTATGNCSTDCFGAVCGSKIGVNSKQKSS